MLVPIDASLVVICGFRETLVLKCAPENGARVCTTVKPQADMRVVLDSELPYWSERDFFFLSCVLVFLICSFMPVYMPFPPPCVGQTLAALLCLSCPTATYSSREILSVTDSAKFEVKISSKHFFST